MSTTTGHTWADAAYALAENAPIVVLFLGLAIALVYQTRRRDDA